MEGKKERGDACKTSRILIGGVVFAIVAIASAFLLGYFGEPDGARETVRGAETTPKSATGAVFPARPVKSVSISPEKMRLREERVKKREAKEKARLEREEKRRAEREARAREREIEEMRREELPDELRYKHRPKLPKRLQRRIDAERELRHIRMTLKRHPERAEELAKRCEELEKTIASLRRGRAKRIGVSPKIQTESGLRPMNKGH